MLLFNEFINHKEREDREHLSLISKILTSGNQKLEVKELFNDGDPYLFVKAPNENFSFEGIRIYPRGKIMAFRIQNAEDTQPFGKAYGLNMDKMFADFMGETMDADEAAKKVSESVRREINRFFELTGKAEEDMAGTLPDKGYILKTGGSDYSSLVFNKL